MRLQGVFLVLCVSAFEMVLYRGRRLRLLLPFPAEMTILPHTQ